MTWPKQKWNYSDAASQIDAFLARRAGPLAELRDAFAKEWRVRQWATGICEEGFI